LTDSVPDDPVKRSSAMQAVRVASVLVPFGPLPFVADEVDRQRLDVLAVVFGEDVGGVVVAKSNAGGHALVARARRPDRVLACRQLVGTWLAVPDLFVARVVRPIDTLKGGRSGRLACGGLAGGARSRRAGRRYGRHDGQGDGGRPRHSGYAGSQMTIGILRSV
jgi:hypothetical protein